MQRHVPGLPSPGKGYVASHFGL